MVVRSPTGTDQTDLVYVVVELDSSHPIPVNWNSDDPSTGYARILMNPVTQEIVRMELVVDGMYVENGDNLLQSLETYPVQPFHFHNQPQGGPNFIVEQLFDVDSQSGAITTATLEDTDSGFRFAIDEPYTLRTPVNNPNLTVDFVFDEIFAGNAYLGVHTNDNPVPYTSIAGDMVALSTGGIDGKILWLDDADDFVFGGRKVDLLSLGGGDDTAHGLNGDDIIDGGAGNDRMFGDRGDDTVWGGDGDDIAHGGLGDDRLFGNRGDDKLFGELGDDEMDGGKGADLLVGGFGDDRMTGGDDADVFRFGLFSGNDVVTDYNPDEDMLQFVGGQRVLGATLADLDGGGVANDTLLQLIGGEVAVLNVDVTSDYLI